MSWIAEYDTQGREFPTCVHVIKTTGTMTRGATYVPIEDGKAARAENAKLRTFLGGGSIVTDYWKDEDGTMHVLTTDGEHTYEYMRGGLADENAKLRELVRDMWNGMCGYWHDCRSCEHYELYEGQRIVGECQYHARMRELGVEV